MYFKHTKKILYFLFRHLQIPPLPNGLQIMADQGFPNIPPLLLPVAPPGIDIPDYILRLEFSKIKPKINIL